MRAKAKPPKCGLCRWGSGCDDCMINKFMQRAKNITDNPVVSPLRGMTFTLH